MTVDKDTVRSWLETGKARNADFMLVTFDSFDGPDGEHYPVYCTFAELADKRDSLREYDVWGEDDEHDDEPVIEVYDLRADWEEQLAEKKTWRWPRDEEGQPMSSDEIRESAGVVPPLAAKSVHGEEAKKALEKEALEPEAAKEEAPAPEKSHPERVVDSVIEAAIAESEKNLAGKRGEEADALRATMQELKRAVAAAQFSSAEVVGWQLSCIAAGAQIERMIDPLVREGSESALQTLLRMGTAIRALGETTGSPEKAERLRQAWNGKNPLHRMLIFELTASFETKDDRARGERELAKAEAAMLEELAVLQSRAGFLYADAVLLSAAAKREHPKMSEEAIRKANAGFSDLAKWLKEAGERSGDEKETLDAEDLIGRLEGLRSAIRTWSMAGEEFEERLVLEERRQRDVAASIAIENAKLARALQVERERHAETLREWRDLYHRQTGELVEAQEKVHKLHRLLGERVAQDVKPEWPAKEKVDPMPEN